MDATDLDFEEKVITRSKTRVVLVDFWAPWCGPCLALGPVLEKLADAPGARFDLVKVNVDESPTIAGEMGVRGIPYVVAFKDGAPAKAFTGALPEAEVKRFVDEVCGTETNVADLLQPALDAIFRRDLEGAREAIAALRMNPEAAPHVDELESRLALTEEIERADDPEFKSAAERALASEFEAAADILFARLDVDQERARALLVNVITLADDDTARDLRRRLASALF